MQIKFLIKGLTVVLLPIFTAVLLYPPQEKVIFNGKDYQQTEFKIEDLFQKKPTFKNLIADIFSVPLFLDWYKVSIRNNSIMEIPSCLIGEPPTVFFTFLKGDPREYYSNLKETTEYTGGYSEKTGPGHPSYYLESGGNAFFIAPSWKEYSIDGGLMISGDCTLTIEVPNDDFGMTAFDYDISVRPYWPSWIVRLLIIFVFWIILLSSAISIKKWLLKRR